MNHVQFSFIFYLLYKISNLALVSICFYLYIICLLHMSLHLFCDEEKKSKVFISLFCYLPLFILNRKILFNFYLAWHSFLSFLITCVLAKRFFKYSAFPCSTTLKRLFTNIKPSRNFIFKFPPRRAIFYLWECTCGN